MNLKGFIKKFVSPSAGTPGHDMVKLRGDIEIRQFGPDGRLKHKQDIRNTIVNVGKFTMSSRLNGVGALPAFNYLALGSDSTVAAAAQSLLIAELTGANASGAARVQASVSRVTTTTENDTAQLFNSFSILQSMQIQEVGAFNLSGANNGQMLGRQVVTAINAQAGDTVQVTYKFQF